MSMVVLLLNAILTTPSNDSPTVKVGMTIIENHRISLHSDGSGPKRLDKMRIECTWIGVSKASVLYGNCNRETTSFTESRVPISGQGHDTSLMCSFE